MKAETFIKWFSAEAVPTVTIKAKRSSPAMPLQHAISFLYIALAKQSPESFIYSGLFSCAASPPTWQVLSPARGSVFLPTARQGLKNHLRCILFFFNGCFLTERFFTNGFATDCFATDCFAADAAAGEGLTATESRSLSARGVAVSDSMLVLGR